MSDTAKRRRFQFHLLTAILLIFALGFDLLLWNHSTNLVEFQSSDNGTAYSNDFGFPISFYWHDKFRWNDSRTLLAVFVNLPVHVWSLSVLVIACELILRHRKARKQ